MNNKFSENLKKIRKDHNLSQEQLADELGVSRQAISKWESAQAYPEMDKIITLCDKFNLNIDDLLHKDIREIKKEEEGKKNINNYVNEFLKFITNSVNMFCDLSFKNKVKLIIEELLIILALVCLAYTVETLLMSLIQSCINFAPYKVYNFISSIFNAILGIMSAACVIIITVYVYKKRYLDYYVSLKREVKEEKEEKEEPVVTDNNEVNFETKKESKIIIRDNKNGDYRITSVFHRIIIFTLKFIVACMAIGTIFVLVGTFVSIVLSFLVAKTGLAFVGLLILLLSLGLCSSIILTAMLNFLFDRKANKKILIGGFLLSVISFGLGCGLFTLGIYNFDYVEDYNKTTVVETEHEMKDNLVLLYPYSYDEVEYEVTDSNKVKIEYEISDVCRINEMEYKTEKYGEYVVDSYFYCTNPIKVVREFINNFNDKKITPISSVVNVKVSSSKENIEKIKSNIKAFYNNRDYSRKVIEDYEDRIEDLEEEMIVFEN